MNWRPSIISRRIPPRFCCNREEPPKFALIRFDLTRLREDEVSGHKIAVRQSRFTGVSGLGIPVAPEIGSQRTWRCFNRVMFSD